MGILSVGMKIEDLVSKLGSNRLVNKTPGCAIQKDSNHQ